jgi:hypothetical protein
MKSPRITDVENLMIEREDPELLARYAHCKRELLAWEAKFERLNGRPSSEQDKVADLTYQGLMARYKRLKHAKRKLLRGSDINMSPRDHQPALASPAVAPAAVPSSAAPAASAACNGGGHACGTPGNSFVNPSSSSSSSQAPSSVTATKTPNASSRRAAGAASPAGAEKSAAKEGSPARPKSAKRKSKAKKNASKEHDRSVAGEASPDVRSHTMTVSMKASHPSPRALGACDETFD